MVCRHCYHLVAPSDPQLALDRMPIAAPGSGPRGRDFVGLKGCADRTVPRSRRGVPGARRRHVRRFNRAP